MKKIIIALVLLITLTSCEARPPSTYQMEGKQLEENQNTILKNSKIPVITDSLERSNISRRAEIFNKSDKLSYIYLISYGKIMAFYTVKWKISSVSSYLTPQEKLVNRRWENCADWVNTDCYSVQAPDIDGSYWTNWDGIFFFTTEWAYVEWKWEYLMSDFPLQITDKPTLVKEVK